MNKEQCYKLWCGNRDYVEHMGADLHINEARLLAKKQDALYKAWADGNFSQLNPTS